MSTSLLRVVERAQQDAEQGPEAIQSNGLRRVSAPPTPTGRGPARSAHETLGRTLQLLRSERQPSKSGPSGSRHATGLAKKMAAPSQPAHASHVGAVQPIVGNASCFPGRGLSCGYGGRSHEAHHLAKFATTGSGIVVVVAPGIVVRATRRIRSRTRRNRFRSGRCAGFAPLARRAALGCQRPESGDGDRFSAGQGVADG